MTGIQITDTAEMVADSHIAIIAGRYNRAIVDRLVDACFAALVDKGIDKEAISLVEAPGAFELPLLAKRLAKRNDIDAVIALGVVIRGETAHFDYVAGECAHGLARVALDHEKPVIFGVLTVDNERQARQRAGDDNDNKGVEAAHAALEMISIMRKLEP